jgi:hypothetical protein
LKLLRDNPGLYSKNDAPPQQKERKSHIPHRVFDEESQLIARELVPEA